MLCLCFMYVMYIMDVIFVFMFLCLIYGLRVSVDPVNDYDDNCHHNGYI